MIKLPSIASHVCSGCTCLCDDIESSAGDANSPNFDSLFSNACEIGQQWLSRPTHSQFVHHIDGQPAELDSAILQAKTLLEAAVSPLVCGLEMLGTESQQSAFRFADRWRATIDTTLTNAGRSSQFSLARVGKVTATLGEVAQRSDVVVFWFCDPATTHPRHLERYSNPATGLKSGARRQVICIDDHESETAKQADIFLKVSRSEAANVLAILRGIVSGIELDAPPQLPIDSIRQLGERLLCAKYGALFYGSTKIESTFDLMNDSLARLVRALNQQTRFVSIPMRNDFNALSAENVMAWSSGYSFSVNLNRGFPRANQLEYSSESILSRGECDLVVLGSTRNLAVRLQAMAPAAMAHWNATPKIVMCESGEGESADAAVQFSVLETGRNVTGEFCRQDDVSLPIRVATADDDGVCVEELLGRL